MPYQITGERLTSLFRPRSVALVGASRSCGIRRSRRSRSRRPALRPCWTGCAAGPCWTASAAARPPIAARFPR
jgi:hypothetical protein